MEMCFADKMEKEINKFPETYLYPRWVLKSSEKLITSSFYFAKTQTSAVNITFAVLFFLQFVGYNKA